MANRYTRALKQIKDKTLDEKLELLSEIPTNNAGGLYTDVPGEYETPPPEQLLPRGADLSQDGDGESGYTGNDTTGLFLDDGTILLEEPIGDTSYILGPMMSMWYAWANYTQIGYVRQSDRKMVNLGRIVGEMSDWDGETGFTSYGQLSLEQAVWFKEQSRSDYRAFYPGPPSNPADSYGRYLGSMIDTPKPTTRQGDPFWSPGTQRGFNPTDDHALAMLNLEQGGSALGIGLVLWMMYEGGKVIKKINDILDDATPTERERLFDRNTSQFGDTDAAGRAAEQNIGYEMASARGPYGTPGADKPYVRRGYKDKEGKFVDFDNPATWPSIVPKPPRASSTTNTMVAHYIAHGHFIKEQASGGGTITAHTDAGDVTINLPSTPPMPPEDGGMKTSPQGVDPLTDYSKNQLDWLKVQESEYYVAGYVKGTAEDPARLEKMFAGTTVSWTRVTSMVSEINEIEKARDEANVRYSEHWDLISPQISSLLAQMSGLADTPADFYGKYLPLSRQVDALYAEHDRIFDECISLSEQYLTLSGQLGRYVQSGKIVDMDPFKLNDPTIKKEKELDEKEISDLINQLKKENNELKQRILLNKLKAFGYGALLLAGAVVGFKLLMGGAGLKALGAPVVNQLKKLAPKVTKVPTPKDPTLPTKVANAVDDALSNLMKNVHNDPTSKSIFNQLTRAQQSGSTSAAERALDAFAKYKGAPGTKGLFNSHQPSGKLLTESQKRVIRNIKKPVQVKEIPTKVKVSPKLRNKNKTVGADMMKTPNTPDQFKPPAPNIWASKDRKANIRASQEKKNQVLELVGAAEHHWTYLTEQKRKEHQAKVNEMMSAEFDKQMELLYEKYKAKESKLDKAISAFRKPTDIKPAYPKTPPPEMDPETGMHPKYGKKYKHDKLDPHSAEAMPPTGDPVIDANIKKATNAKEKARKLKILMGKMKRG